MPYNENMEYHELKLNNFFTEMVSRKLPCGRQLLFLQKLPLASDETIGEG